jgi:hypothetical protein
MSVCVRGFGGVGGGTHVKIKVYRIEHAYTLNPPHTHTHILVFSLPHTRTHTYAHTYPPAAASAAT